MRLPVEIRLQVYKDYLIDRYSLSAAEIYETVLDRDHRTKRPPEILQVSKAVNAEVKDILRQEDTFTLRVCCQDATFDGLVRSCFQTKGLAWIMTTLRILESKYILPTRIDPMT